MYTVILHKLRKTKLGTKLLLSYLLVVLLPVLIIGYLIIYKNSGIMLEQARQINIANFKQMTNNASNLFDKYVQISNNLNNEYYLTSYIDSYSTNEDLDVRYFKYRDMYRPLKNKLDIIKLGGEVVRVYTTNDTIITQGDLIKDLDETIQNQSWYKEAISAKGANVVGRPHLVGKRMVIPLGRIMKYNESHYTNILKIEIPIQILYELIKNEDSNINTFILNESNHVVIATNMDIIGKDISDIPELSALNIDRLIDSKEITTNIENKVIFYKNLQIPGIKGNLKFVKITSNDWMMRQISDSINNSILIWLVSLGMAIILILIFSKTITRRITLLAKNMSSIREDNLEVSILCDYGDEIGELSKVFKNMIDRIKTLINEVYMADLHIKELELKKKEAELHALQSQINPHFLFNTMEAIRMNLLKNGEVEVSSTIKHFAVLLRRSIGWSKDNITLKQEFSLIEAYLKIQKFRFKEKLNYNIFLSEEMNNYIIPKFSLQPIVENSMYHGLERKETRGTIDINTESFDDVIKIIIMDDGVGINAEELININNMLDDTLEKQENSENYESIGLKNVHQRIKLNYGNEYGIKIRSTEGVGTIVEVLLPKNMN